ncbi:GNAT family N-acetyltransferase [Neobacillus thermocopriae]|uniref:GNAT family N-acetyltransferase n=1 Tax=Neobacillus thermocopriae TaxID=1215031 RepID=A0A6B3TPW6_9BACI|nr:GNAT family N-acetyltransferase [Neobacillus thermocopriae]MED3624091.1 GNAT family N-acetyltransferase [Neobacillus thermocopriae]MED3713714.1 GNAT family N-acetyltransferase [Neobacillus thermocopriae]NEX78141.1 GNAT family N-acetyltransferase [Neobacillus thermocopriae]
MEQLSLIRPSMDYESEYLAFYNEWKESGEVMIPTVINKDPTNFQNMIQFLLDSEQGKNLPANRVPASTFWLVNEKKKVIGVVNIRHQLTESLFHSGGHIGYGIRPSERRKGYATKLLSLSLEKAKELALEKVLLVCDAKNIGSEKTILKNGGIPDKDFMKEDGTILKRYWIHL